ncbi:hypothetical protein N7532_004014 [Penicillium argentinense]|uniref:Uncharacterized protein n=1 Tax=Penicillium argentinense TaxID=1131581 RepID=A0A9W9KEE7_9EURO|nr:uncharacterized protein N7532_004014 [Penicillium argentinense]KAJ5103485.1 hypothetical protein N7532_004014 [Penicillium argentinense]
MSPMLLNRLSDGPATVLSPHQEHAFAQFPSQSLLDPSGGFNSYPASPSSVFANNGSAQPASSSDANSATVAPKPCRKRSRDEAAFEEAFTLNAPSEPQPPPAPKAEPIYGEGMVLLNPDTGMALSAESQTGTWYEEKAESQHTAGDPISSRSIALQSDAAEISRKSQRLDQSAPGLDDIALSSIRQRLSGPDYNDQHRSLPSGSTPPSEPHIDDATLLLGISWQRIDTDDDMAPAVRGWTKYIDNQYAAHLRRSQMLLKSRALSAFLVSATPLSSFSTSFYLFNDDLTQCQLVASSWDACLQNLRCTPIVFEGSTPLVAAARSASPPDANPFASNTETGVPLLQQALSNHSHAPTGMDAGMGQNGGVEMGMEIDS